MSRGMYINPKMKQSYANFYQKYHRLPRVQGKIISSRHFTYGEHIEYISQYIQGKSILDIGCGVGTIDFYFASKGVHVVGIDVSKNAIRVAKKSAQALGVKKNSVFYTLEFPRKLPKGKYDFIIFSEVLEHISDENKAVVGCYRLLRRKGRILITVPLRSSLLYQFGLATSHDTKAGHLRRYNNAELKKLVEKHGFRILEIVEKEGLLREALFMYSVFGLMVKVANRFTVIGRSLTFLDKIFIKIFGGSHVFIIAERI